MTDHNSKDEDFGEFQGIWDDLNRKLEEAKKNFNNSSRSNNNGPKGRIDVPMGEVDLRRLVDIYLNNESITLFSDKNMSEDDGKMREYLSQVFPELCGPRW